MKTYELNDIACIEIVRRGWRYEQARNNQYNYPRAARVIRFKSPQNRERTRQLADRLEQYSSIFIVRCFTSKGTFI